MFKKTIAYLILLIIITFTIAACEESVFVSEALEVDLTSENKDFFYNSGMLRIKSRINGVGPLGFLFHTIEKIKGRKEVKTIDENLLTFPTCVNKYFFIKEDGEFQYMLEFTPGCQWLGELYSGSYLETGKFTLNESDSIEIYGHATYNDFSSNNWTINGSYEYCGSALIDGILIDDGSILLDEDDFNYSSNIHFSFDLTEIFINENQVITIFSNGYESEHFIDEGILIEQQEIISTIQSGPTFSTWIKEQWSNIIRKCEP